MNTIKNNKLIAEFMNYANNRPITDSLANKLYNDWNSLMQVVEKIESLGYNIDTMKVDITKYQSSQFCGIYIDGKRIYTNYCETKIEAVYNACVEFIKWYNNNK